VYDSNAVSGIVNVSLVYHDKFIHKLPRFVTTNLCSGLLSIMRRNEAYLQRNVRNQTDVQQVLNSRTLEDFYNSSFNLVELNTCPEQNKDKIRFFDWSEERFAELRNSVPVIQIDSMDDILFDMQ